MNAKLIGTNICIDELKERGIEDLSPETIAFTYGRISHSKDTIAEIREQAKKDINKVRDFNNRIVFEYGHSSIAEHVYFNFDINNISRYAVEYLESFRLCSYTEKSQRYVEFKEDYIVPKEILEKDLIKRYNDLVLQLFELYLIIKKSLAVDMMETGANEVARYVLPLCTATQLGLSLNARNLEYMIIRLKSSGIKELEDIGDALYDEVKDVCPSLIKYVDKDDYYKNELDKNNFDVQDYCNRYPVMLVDWTNDADERLLAALLYHAGNATYSECCNAVHTIFKTDIEKGVEQILSGMKSYHSVPREFEMIDMTFDVIVSASCYAQLKRHRLLTLIPQQYDIMAPVKVPVPIDDDLRIKFMSLVEEINQLSQILKSQYGSHVASYVLTNAHTRRVLVKMNLRELYHMSRLREDSHAQEEIRVLVSGMTNQIRKKMPIASKLLGGKDQYAER